MMGLTMMLMLLSGFRCQVDAFVLQWPTRNHQTPEVQISCDTVSSIAGSAIGCWRLWVNWILPLMLGIYKKIFLKIFDTIFEILPK